MNGAIKSCFTAVVMIILVSAVIQGFYKPGVFRTKNSHKINLVPPSQQGIGADYWKVEESILIFHFSQGKGRNVLVIHGGPGIPPQQAWESLDRIQGYKFHFYHQRGCGNSTHPIERFESQNFMKNMAALDRMLGMEAQLADIERIRQILGEDKLILVGHSYGAFMAALYAYEFPEHVEKMVLLSPAGVLSLPPSHGGMDRIKEYLSEKQKDEYDVFLKDYFDYANIFKKTEAELAELNSRYGMFYTSALKRRGLNIPAGTASVVGVGGWMVHGIYVSLGKKYDFRRYIQEIMVPVLIVHGDADLYPIEASKEYADLLKNSRLEVISGASHFVFVEKPEEFSRVVDDFLD